MTPVARYDFEVASLHGLLMCLLVGCGGSSTPTTPAPAPTITAISPTTATRGGPAFTLTVTGSNFVPRSVVAWNGSNRATTLVSSTQLTAQISTNDILVAGTEVVTVSNGTADGGSSNSLTFTIPCVLATASPVSAQSRARLGIYYFDGWAGPPDSYHLKDFINSPYQDRQPLSGWRDDNRCAVEQQLAWAHSFGISFFVFDWYFNASSVDHTEDLNSAIKITRALPDRHGMEYAITYINADPFIVGPSDWPTAVNEWASYLVDPAYVRVNGKPVFLVYDPVGMHTAFGSAAAVAGAFNALRSAAVARGLPGVYIVAEIGVWAGSAGQNSLFPDYSWTAADGYDALSMYGWSGAWPQGMTSGNQPFSILADAGRWIWSQVALKSPLPFIASVMDGWDPRPCAAAHDPACPWNPQTTTWFTRTPQDVASLVGDAVTWAQSTPQVRPEPAPAPPIVLMEAWNELTEGSYVVPTEGDGTSYGDALAAMLLVVPTPMRTGRRVSEAGVSDPHRITKHKGSDARWQSAVTFIKRSNVY